MSVFLRDCAEQSGHDVCTHARKWYPNIAGEPPIFYIIEEAEIPEGGSVQMSKSTSGDDCHGDIVGLSDGRLGTTFKGKNWADYLVCTKDGARSLTQADLDEIMNKRTQK